MAFNTNQIFTKCCGHFPALTPIYLPKTESGPKDRFSRYVVYLGTYKRERYELFQFIMNIYDLITDISKINYMSIISKFRF